jgi:hypothetical protein
VTVARWKLRRAETGAGHAADYTSAFMDQLALIRRAAKRRESRRAAFDEADEELRRLVREGFDQGLSGEQLAEAASLSLSRIYQIRDGRRK